MSIDLVRYPEAPLAGLPYAWGGPVGSGWLRVAPEDFQVEELGLVEPCGAGEHLWLWVEKRGANSDWVAGQLAQAAGVGSDAVSYAGRKDRHALTWQWFSLHLPTDTAVDLPEVPCEGARILRRVRHGQKLRTGALLGNRFTLTLRAVQADHQALAQRIEALNVHGYPNWFGEQRFGHANGNVHGALAMFAEPKVRISRNLRSLYLSAARAWIFNQVLAARVEAGTWCEARVGDCFNLDGSDNHTLALVVDDALRERLRRGAIHTTGPLWGTGRPQSARAVVQEELSIAAAWPELREGLERMGLRPERRAQRVLPRELQAQWLDAQTLRLDFVLPAGAFATSLLRELLELEDRGSVATSA